MMPQQKMDGLKKTQLDSYKNMLCSSAIEHTRVKVNSENNYLDWVQETERKRKISLIEWIIQAFDY